MLLQPFKITFNKNSGDITEPETLFSIEIHKIIILQ